MVRLSAPNTVRLADEDAEQVRRDHAAKIAELQKLPASSLTVLPGVTLSDGVATPIAHKLGRPVVVLVSAPRGAVTSGRIEEVRDGTQDRSLYVTLKATGWGGPIVADVVVL